MKLKSSHEDNNIVPDSNISTQINGSYIIYFIYMLIPSTLY